MGRGPFDPAAEEGGYKPSLTYRSQGVSDLIPTARQLEGSAELLPDLELNYSQKRASVIAYESDGAERGMQRLPGKEQRQKIVLWVVARAFQYLKVR